MSDSPPQFTPSELQDWQQSLEEANRHNVFCHCRECGSCGVALCDNREWVASNPEACVCGSKNVESIACWQFPDG